MRFNIRKIITKLYIKKNIIEFSMRKFILGFENANKFLQRVDKNSIIPILKKNKAIIGENCDIESGLIFHNCNDYSNLIIGNNCHIGKNCLFDLRNKIIIGNNVVISMQCTFITHIDLSKSLLKMYYPATSESIKINDNCYIGAKSLILKGIEIGECSIIAAGSVVIKNVEPRTLVAGVPAKEIKKIK